MYKEWIIRADQWFQDYYLYSNGKLSWNSNDNKDQSFQTTYLDIDQFIDNHEPDTESPYPEMVLFFKSLAEISGDNLQVAGNNDKSDDSPTVEG